MIKDDFNEHDKFYEIARKAVTIVLTLGMIFGILASIFLITNYENAVAGILLIIVSILVFIFAIVINETIFSFFYDIKCIRNKLYEKELKEEIMNSSTNQNNNK